MTDPTTVTLDGAWPDLTVSRDAVRWHPARPWLFPTMSAEAVATVIRRRRRAAHVGLTRRRMLALSSGKRLT